MTKKLFVANWKSNKTIQETLSFLDEFKSLIAELDLSEKEIVLCPSFTDLAAVQEYIQFNHLTTSIGSQNISEFGIGAYTGEVNNEQLKEFVTYVIIGHSERRHLLHETDEIVAKKISQALKVGLIPILCIQDQNTPIPPGVTYVAYEPIFAIGSGTPDTPENISQVFSEVLGKNPQVRLLYGGSVKPENIISFSAIDTLSGFLIGGASLSPQSFYDLLK